MVQNAKEEYYFLTEKLEEIDWALEGLCNDIDCDKYIYKDLLKKKYKSVIEHNFSCMAKLKSEKEAILRILSQRRYHKYRHEKCNVCKKEIDKLSPKNVIVSFTKPVKKDKLASSQWKGVWAHKKCSSRVKIPKGWNKFFCRIF